MDLITESKRRRWLCVPPIVYCLFDHSITMVSQPDVYWSGHLEFAQEANPLVNFVMVRSHLFYHLLPFVWLAIVSLVILKVPRSLALWISLSVTLGHMFCACTWFYFKEGGYYLSLLVCLSCAGVLSVSLGNWHTWDEKK